MDEKVQNNKYTDPVEIEGDSILDFKSPEFAKSNIKLRKKEKSRNVRKSQKDVKFKHAEKRKNLQQSQPSIESSFFKPKKENEDKDQKDDVKVALLCPLCLKTFKDVDSQAVHMKICACKNNISTKKLLDAIDLQKRQEDERKSLGLLAAPIIQEKKKLVPRKTNSHVDSDLQLALALSKSLQEAEVLEEVNEIEQLSEIPNKTTLEITESISKCQLEKFGFANTKSATLTKKKRKFIEITVLQTRTQDERNRILTEKIAEILMGDEPFTQEIRVSNKEITAKTILKSHLLRKLYYKDEKLWDKAGLTSNQISFYVSNLSEYIPPREEQIKLQENDYKEGDQNLCQNETEKSMNKEIFYKVSQSDLNLSNKECENLDDEQYIDTLATNWRNTLNDSSASDIIIFVDDNKYIWAHKLVFYVQCSNILLDVVPNDNSQFATIKEKIFWPDITYNIALAFLEFIYCGNIKKYCDIFENVLSYSILRSLARKYKVKELFPYLQGKETKTKQTKVQTENIKSMELEKTLIMKEVDNWKEYSNISKDLTCENKEELILQEDEKLSKNVCREQKNQRVVCLSQMSPIRHCNESPDMFDDVNESVPNYNEKSINQTADFNEKQRYNNVDTLNSVNLTIDTDSNKIEDSVSPKNIEGNINFLLNTPQSSRSKRWSVNHSNLKKTKSNLSIFIEKFQMENAKSDSVLDSEITILPVSQKYKRNPFNIGNDSSHQDSMLHEINVTKRKSENKRDVLNKFDCITSLQSPIQTILKETNADVNLTFESIDNLTELLQDNNDSCTEDSVENNTININISNTNDMVQNDEVSPITETFLKDLVSDESLNSVTTKCNESDTSNESDVYSDNAEESIYTRYKKEHQNNSIAKYRDFIKKCVLESSVENSSEDDSSEEEINLEKEDITILSDEDIGCDFTAILQRKRETVSDLEKSDRSFFKSPTNFNKTFDSSIKHQRNTKLHNASKLRSTKSESSIDARAIKHNLSVSSPDRKLNELNSIESPVLILSSPEIDFDVPNVDTSKNKVNNDISNPIEFDNYTHIFEKEIYLANVCINNDSTDGSKIKETSLVESNKKNHEQTTTNNYSRTQVEKSLSTQQSIRKFQRKSVSETSLNITAKSMKNNALQSFVNVNQSLYKCGNKQVSRKSKSTLIKDSTTPPPDYDGMKTPELHAELNKYGLKLQKRSRATKLLTYIYNELHPVIPLTSKKVISECVVVNSDDEEPPMKKKSYSKNDDCNNDCRSELVSSKGGTEKSSTNIINEKRTFDEHETAITNTALNIKDEFFKLLKDQKELHNNILTYEPLCIESLHSMLKEKGFKCKMNTLMDFLDEQMLKKEDIARDR